jgi:hypothetical protein
MRAVGPETRVGVHQIFHPDAVAQPALKQFSGDDLVQQQMFVGVLQDFASEMGVDQSIVALAARTPPTEMRWLSRDELVAYKLDNVPREPGLPAARAETVPASPPLAAPRPPAVSPEPAAPVAASPETLPPSPPVAVAPPFDPRLVRAAEAAAIDFVGTAIDIQAEDASVWIDHVGRSYANVVDYFGKVSSLDVVLDDKRAYAARWPHRAYIIEADTLRARCSADARKCTVTGRLFWQAGRVRGRVDKAGRAAFSFDVVDPLDTPLITGEGGRVIR